MDKFEIANLEAAARSAMVWIPEDDRTIRYRNLLTAVVPAVGILGVAVLIAALCTLLFVVAYRRHPGPSYSTSKTVLLGLALPIVVLALAYNSYWAATMLALPCWIWCLAGGGSGWNARLRHWAWILAGAIPCCMVAADFASRFGMGPNAVWYQILALNTGLFSAAGFFLGIAAAAIGVRFLVGQLHACP